jgi:ferredoxin/flavodoxin---NADP+ reductase
VRLVGEERETVRGKLTISSIGSIPEPIPGIPQKGEVYTYVDSKVGLLMDGPTSVFAAGNVLTGKGNIKDSLESGTEIGVRVAEAYLGLNGGEEVDLVKGARRAAEFNAQKIASVIDHRELVAPEIVDKILARVRARQLEVGYDGDFREWIRRVTPPDLE